MDNIIDTAKMRDAAQDTVRNRISPHLRDVWLLTSSHYDGCEYEHYVCAVLKLCDEVDALRAELAEARAEVERWIPVSERLPEEPCYCICCMNNALTGKPFVAPINYVGGGFFESMNGLITHWMPLPPAPEVEP